MASEDVEVFLGERHEINLFEHPNSLDEYLEDGLLGSVVKTVVAKGDMDTGLEGVVKRLRRG